MAKSLKLEMVYYSFMRLIFQWDVKFKHEISIKDGYTFGKVAFLCSADTFMIIQSLVFHINNCCKIITFAKQETIRDKSKIRLTIQY